MSCRVAIIDDKVNVNFLLRECVCVDAQTLKLCEKESIHDFTLSHATIIATILEQNCDAHLFNVMIKSSFEHNSNIEMLKMAFKWCIQNQIDIINLSIGTKNFYDHIQLEHFVKELNDCGIILVAAAANDNSITFPAAFNNVVGVKYNHHIAPHRHIYVHNPFDGISILSGCQTSCNHIFFEACNSFATAFICAKICNYYSRTNNVGFIDITQMLISSSDTQQHICDELENVNCYRPLTKPVIAISIANKENKKIIESIVLEFLKRHYIAAAFMDDISNVQHNVFNKESVFAQNPKMTSLQLLKLLDATTNADLLIFEDSNDSSSYADIKVQVLNSSYEISCFDANLTTKFIVDYEQEDDAVYSLVMELLKLIT
ncbi:MAG: S8 family serine peptidase [Christensenellaceae bacterium]